ncbi:Methylglyoxal synthase [Rhodospirillaceae bacterium LM-1]|nr:Methylglyoxal synthase [Rhodospirillaceae bacterium LM-1]
MPEFRTLILLAHKRHLPALVKLMKKERPVFESYRLLSTVEVGTVIEKEVGLEVTSVFPGSKGGEIQLCGLVCSNSVAAVYFLRDPLSAGGSEPEISPFYRACDLNNVPLASNLLTAVALTHWLGRKLPEEEE